MVLLKRQLKLPTSGFLGFDPGVLASKLKQQSYWAVRMSSGKIYSEWEPRDWLDLPEKGRVGIRLYTPDGKYYSLEDDRDATGRIFQFKIALATAGMGRGRLSHVIGLVTGYDGQSVCYAWESDDQSGHILGPFIDNFNQFKYGAIGQLSALHLGIKEN